MQANVSTAAATRSFFPDSALDHAFAGLTAGCVATLFTHPLDLLRTRFQVSSAPIKGGVGRAIYGALRDIRMRDGWAGLYRGIWPNCVGNVAGWGLYFLWYEMLKRRMSNASADPTARLSPGGYLLASAEASAITALMTNPIWVVKVRIFTSRPGDPGDYKSISRGLYEIGKNEGIRGLYRGATFSLLGVSNGALQFMAYEELKHVGFRMKRKGVEKAGGVWREGEEKLSNIEYMMMSGTAKLFALATVYPYQVIRARLQSNDPKFPTIPATIRLTYLENGLYGFYRGLATNMVRMLPATCVTFVVYENVAWLLRRAAGRRDDEKEEFQSRLR